VNTIQKIGHFCEVEGDGNPYLIQFYSDWAQQRFVLKVYLLDRHGAVLSCRYDSLNDEDARGFRLGYHQLVLRGLGTRLPKTVFIRADYDRSRQETPDAIIHGDLCAAQHRDWYHDLFCHSSHRVA